MTLDAKNSDKNELNELADILSKLAGEKEGDVKELIQEALEKVLEVSKSKKKRDDKKNVILFLKSMHFP